MCAADKRWHEEVRQTRPGEWGEGGRWREQAVRNGMLNGVGCIGTRNSFGGDDGVKAGRSVRYALGV